jgi:AcrR family transcriptional regulator
MVATSQPDERRRQRQAARREANRIEILDAAERVYGEVGIHNASIRAIAHEAGFSPAGIYLFFDNRDELLKQTLRRRGEEHVGLITDAIAAASEPCTALHRLADDTLVYYQEHRSFWRMLNQIRGATIKGEPFSYAPDEDEIFRQAEALILGLVKRGQKDGSIRRGDPRSFMRYYLVLLQEYVHLNLEVDDVRRSASEFHALIDRALGPSA